MNNMNFFDALEQVKTNLVNHKINTTMNSIGSNIFFRFGKDIEYISPVGKKWLRKEWTIWIGDASWRITKKGKYFVSSGDEPRVIKENIEKLLGKHFQSVNFLSQFLDAEFNFEDGFQLTTFFNWAESNQWTLSLPTQFIKIDCSNKEAIRIVKAISNYCSIEESYQKIDLPMENLTIKNIIYNEFDLPTFFCENHISISLEFSLWRLEKNNDYFMGYLDDNRVENKEKLFEIIGEKIKRIDIANSMMDARFQIGDQYVLKIFTACPAVNQWNIFYKDDPIFAANIQVSDEHDFYIEENVQG